MKHCPDKTESDGASPSTPTKRKSMFSKLWFTILLQILDWSTTIYIVFSGGGLELNYLIRHLLAFGLILGPTFLLGMKLLGVFFIWPILTKYPKWAVRMNMFYSLIVLFNLFSVFEILKVRYF